MMKLSQRMMGILAMSVLISGCASTQYQKLQRNTIYKKDLGITIDGKRYEGVTVVPHKSSYNIELEAPADIDMILWRSCAREDSGTPKKPGFFDFLSKKRVRYTYTPRSGLEDTGTCPLRIDAYDAKNNQHSWALLVFERPDMQLKFGTDCNGRRKNFNGVGACQQKAGLLSRLQFPEPVMFATPEPSRCPMPERIGLYLYRWEVAVGECHYTVRTRDRTFGKFIIVGYQGVLLRGGI